MRKRQRDKTADTLHFLHLQKEDHDLTFIVVKDFQSGKRSQSASQSSSRSRSQRSQTRAAYVLYCPVASEFQIAGMSLLERQLFALTRSGCHPITIISPDCLPAHSRLRSMKISLDTAPCLPQKAQPCLVIDGNAFFEKKDADMIMRKSAVIQTSQTSNSDSSNSYSTNSNSQTSYSDSHYSHSILRALFLSCPDDWNAFWKTEIPRIPKMQIHSRARNLLSQKAATALGREMIWESSSACDGFVDRFFNRPVSRPFTKCSLDLGISPNLISLTATGLGLVSAFFLSIPEREFSIFGALIFQLSAILDCSDGDVARLHFKESPFGKWLDIAGDQIVHIAIFTGIGIGFINASTSFSDSFSTFSSTSFSTFFTFKLLTFSAVLGVILDFTIFIWASKKTASNPILDRFLKAFANRDFSMIIIILACFDRLDIFILMAGIGIHAFWIGLLILIFQSKKQ